VILETDHPADCASKLINNSVDIGLIPVAVLPLLKEYHIIGDYCIGANGNVRTVMLLSNCTFGDIKNIYLDYRSRSSVSLTKVLAKNSWKREFRWINTTKEFDFTNIGLDEAVVLIGDQCFEFENSFIYKIDLAMEWKKFSGLPFVFACWTSNKHIDPAFIREFNEALSVGVNNIDAVVEMFGNTGTITGDNLRRYLKENIDFNFNEKKKDGLKLFLELMKDL
jgi:chorismate dehydratase